ncbi:cleft lip and palate transmembrane protein 1-domain-containing protein [Spinellus fusiger]|nr:cleft lip and palate transmembrane protein 1-domain-containing protein [Spinellus fusiger]
MPDQVTPPARDGQAATRNPPAPENEQSFFAKHGKTIIQMLVMWLVTQYFIGNRQARKAEPIPFATTTTTTESGPLTQTNRPSSISTDYFPVLPPGVHHNPHPIELSQKDLPSVIYPLWKEGYVMDLLVYLNSGPYFVDYKTRPDWKTSNLVLGTPFDPIEQHLEIPTTKALQNNGTLYAHIFLVRQGVSINPEDSHFFADSVVYVRHTLTKFYPKKTALRQKKLLAKEEESEEESEVEVAGAKKHEQEEESEGAPGFGESLLGNWTRRAPLVAYWHENVTLSIVNDAKSTLPKSSLQPANIKYIPFDTGLTRDASGEVGFFRPIVFPNDFWLLRQNCYPVNETVSTLPLTIHVMPIAMWKFNMLAIFDDSLKQQTNSALGGMSSSETDELKRMFLETNPILLGTTLAVSLLHSLFEFLAFKNDIAFWNKKSNSVGVSVRSLLVNIFFQIVIFLYLMDNNQETSWMILIGQGFGLLIEIWKVFKALKYELVWVPGSLLPRLGAREVESTETEDETAKYDAIAFKYLIWLAYPLLGGYAVYSLLYDEHKSWYSYVLKTLVEFVYMFGFITMVPQLYINYRLQSVAHMPWRTLLYKSLNTFIDDLFAFVIKMPTLHRLACLRDDVVFFVYLYQRYAYKEDHTRANEFGQIGADESKEKKEGVVDKEEETKKTQ